MNYKNIHRRDFIKYQLFGIIWAASGIGLFNPKRLFANPIPDISVVKGSPGPATRAAVDLLGGIKQFVKPGNRVVIKPNMSWSKPVSFGTTTHPEVVKELVVMCKEAEASNILVLDHTIDRPDPCLQNSGIQDACNSISNEIVYAVNDRFEYGDVALPNGKAIQSTEVMKSVLDSDVLISIPVAKSHESTKVTLSLKNMMGLIYNRWDLHRQGLDTGIVDICTVLKPDLIVIDAIRVLASNGPRGPGQMLNENTVIAAKEMVAADAFAVASFRWSGLRLQPSDIAHIKEAHERGLGTMDVDKLNIKRVIL